MANYPYMGAGYKEDEKPYTFAGPENDKKLKKLAESSTSGVSDVIANNKANVADTLQKTSDAYDKAGVFAAAGQLLRGTVSDTGSLFRDALIKPVANTVVRPALNLVGGVLDAGKTALTGEPSTTFQQSNALSAPAPTGLDSPPKISSNIPGDATQVTQLAPHTNSPLEEAQPNVQQPAPVGVPGRTVDGWTASGDPRTGAMMTMGGDRASNVGKGFIRPGSAPNGMGSPSNTVARQQLVDGNPNTASPENINRLKAMGDTRGTTRVGGYSFSGTAGDAAKFFSPVSRPNPTPADLGPYRVTSGSDYAKKEPDVPQHLGPESGIGWKSRDKIYEIQMDAYNKRLANKTAIGVRGMEEAGAGDRALLQAQGTNAHNDILRQQILGQQGVNAADILNKTVEAQGKQLGVDSARQLLMAQQAYSKDPSKENESLLRSLTGKFARDEKSIQAVDELIDPRNPILGTKKSLVRVNEDGTGYTRLQESGSAMAGEPLPKDRSLWKKEVRYDLGNGQFGTYDGKGLRPAR